MAGSHDKKSRQNFPSQDCKIPLEQLSVVSPYADCAVGSVIFSGVEAEMCSQMSPIEEHTPVIQEKDHSALLLIVFLTSQALCHLVEGDFH